MRVSRVSAKFSWNCFIDFFPIFSGVGGGDSGIRSAETCFVKHLETRSCRVPAHIFRLLLRFKHCNVALVTRLVVLAHPLQALNNPPWLSMTSVCGEQSARSKIKGRPPSPPLPRELWVSSALNNCHQSTSRWNLHHNQTATVVVQMGYWRTMCCCHGHCSFHKDP